MLTQAPLSRYGGETTELIRGSFDDPLSCTTYLPTPGITQTSEVLADEQLSMVENECLPVVFTGQRMLLRA